MEAALTTEAREGTASLLCIDTAVDTTEQTMLECLKKLAMDFLVSVVSTLHWCKALAGVLLQANIADVSILIPTQLPAILPLLGGVSCGATVVEYLRRLPVALSQLLVTGPTTVEMSTSSA